jgi:hypothetical protein
MPNTDMSEVELQLVTKRDDAIKALKLEGADEQTVRNELAALEWPSYLCHVNHSDLSGNAWSVKDSRSLLCIQRYSRVAFFVIHKYFFYNRPTEMSVHAKWRSMVDRLYHMTPEDRGKLRELYDEGKSFDMMVKDGDFTNHNALDLETIISQDFERRILSQDVERRRMNPLIQYKY